MIENFFFRSAVIDAALWKMYQKLKNPPVEKKERLVTIYDNGKQFKAVIK